MPLQVADFARSPDGEVAWECDTISTLFRRSSRRDFPTDFKKLEAWRPDPESNRGTRICSPLHSHSAIGPAGRTYRGRPGRGSRSAGRLRPGGAVPITIGRFPPECPKDDDRLRSRAAQDGREPDPPEQG